MDPTVDKDAIFIIVLVLSWVVFIRVQGFVCANFHRGRNWGFKGYERAPQAVNWSFGALWYLTGQL